MKADDTIRVVAKGFLRCLYFGRRVIFGFPFGLRFYTSMFFELACEKIYELM